MTPEAAARYERRVKDLESFGDRGSASERERRAADYLESELRSIGLEPIRESFRGARSLSARLLVHVLVAAIGAALLWRSAAATIMLACLALISLVAEQTTRVVWLSQPVVRFASQNLWARFPVKGPARRRIIVAAHYDTQHSGWVWTINRYLMPIGFRSPLPLKPPMLPVVALMAAQILLGIVAILVERPVAVSILNGLLLAAYGALSILLVQWALGRPVPGAADNASGVAAVLQLAEEWRTGPLAGDDVELIVLLPGCEESGMLGAAAWADRHRDELRSVATVFLNIDGIGFGPPRFLGAEVPAAALPVRTPAEILEICQRVATEQALADAGPHALPGPTDGLAFLARGIAGTTVVGFRDAGILPHYHTFGDTSQNMDFQAADAGVDFARALLRELGEVSGNRRRV